MTNDDQTRAAIEAAAGECAGDLGDNRCCFYSARQGFERGAEFGIAYREKQLAETAGQFDWPAFNEWYTTWCTAKNKEPYHLDTAERQHERTAAAFTARIEELEHDAKYFKDQWMNVRNECLKVENERDEALAALSNERSDHLELVNIAVLLRKERDAALARVETLTDHRDSMADIIQRIERERDDANARIQKLERLVGRYERDNMKYMEKAEIERDAALNNFNRMAELHRLDNLECMRLETDLDAANARIEKLRAALELLIKGPASYIAEPKSVWYSQHGSKALVADDAAAIKGTKDE